MSDTNSKPTLPDRLAGNPRSPHHLEEFFEHQIGIRLNGKERKDVDEYCIVSALKPTYLPSVELRHFF